MKIAISGKAGAGKTTLARAVAKRLDQGCVVSFADSLKIEVRDRFGLTKTDPGGREKLIEYGEACRNADPDYWIRKLEWRVADLLRNDCSVVIDDVRFKRELEWCRRVGYYVVRVDAPTQARVERLTSQGLGAEIVLSRHPGETELDGCEFDFRWLNGGFESCTLDCAAERIVSRSRRLRQRV